MSARARGARQRELPPPTASAAFRPHAKRQTNALTDGSCDLWNAVIVVLLRLVTHHEQAAVLQIHVEHAPRPRLAANRHAPRRTQRKQRDGKSRLDFVEVIVMRGDAVAT